MIKYSLACAAGHEFEAWFDGSDSYERQKAGGQIACAICGSVDVEKALMRPAVATSRRRESVRVAAHASPPPELVALVREFRPEAVAEQFGRLAESTDALVNQEGRPLVADLRQTLRSASESMQQLEGAIGDARPGIQNFSTQTLPEVGQLIRDLRATSESLREITDRLNQRGVGGVIGGQRLPDYRPGRGN